MLFHFVLSQTEDMHGQHQQQEHIQQFVHLLTTVLSYIAMYDDEESVTKDLVEFQLNILTQTGEEVKGFHDLPEAEMGMRFHCFKYFESSRMTLYHANIIIFYTF